ncbi:RNA-binding protein 4.2 [Girardinichthys multiradiatus]|uniref:RNA-binding protein 4.2 n=1 Tax=Girardinichthys multiradiatus TaxID=208333 RepID=UPI001FAB734A|nr:RNA-binding protein 4.2 [Girardinichthys multiradiatus]
MVKIFIGNLASDTSAKELRQLFEKYGKVSECDIVKNFGFVHMNNLSEAEEAIRNLHQTELNGWRINVEMSKGRPKSTAKLHISNLGEGVTSEHLRAKFEEFGPVVECDIVRNYAFVHMEKMEDAMEAINKLDNTAFKGKLINVRLSTSRLRTTPGMGDHAGCFVCGKHGHWSKDCQVGWDGSYGDGTRNRNIWGPSHGMASPPTADYSVYSRASYAGGLPPPPLPPPPRRISAYTSELGGRYASQTAGLYAGRSIVYNRDRLYSSADYYEKYRAQPYGSSYFEERRLSYLPPPPSSLPKLSSSVDPYDRRPLPPSVAAYYARERSPIRRVPVVSPAYSYERKRLSPVSDSTSSYAVLRPKEHYTQRYSPY